MIRLSRDEIEFLLETLPLPAQLAENLRKTQTGDGSVEDDDADALRDLCGERLQTHGFGRNYEINEEGERLERMIDRLFVG